MWVLNRRGILGCCTVMACSDLPLHVLGCRSLRFPKLGSSAGHLLGTPPGRATEETPLHNEAMRIWVCVSWQGRVLEP